MSLGTRINARKKYLDIYRELRSDKPASPRIFKENKDLFILACTIGFKKNEKNEVKNAETLLWSGTLDSHQLTVLKAIAIKSSNENNLDVLDSETEIYRTAEQYADRGMEILIEEVLEDYISEKDDGTLTIIYNEKSQLHKQIFHFVDELNKEATPFI